MNTTSDLLSPTALSSTTPLADQQAPTLFLPQESDKDSGRAQIVFVLGDVHGDWYELNEFLDFEVRESKKIQELAKQYELEVIVLQVGDFGFFWPGEDNSGSIYNDVDWLKDGRVKIYWCDGNHEDHNVLDSLDAKASRDLEHGADQNEVAPGVYYARFGSVLELLDGTRIMFAGGAESCDKAERTAFKSWWPQEGIDEKDMRNMPFRAFPAGLMDKVPAYIDWIVSHTAPGCFELEGYEGEKLTEQSRERLNFVKAVYFPTKWFFGHFHHHFRGEHNRCEYVGLSHISDYGRFGQSKILL